MRAKDFYQYNFEDVYGEQWEYHASNPFLEKKQIPEVDGQIDLAQLYDISVFGEESREEYIRRKMNPLRKCKICVQTFVSGDMVEIDVYPVFSRHDMPRASKKKTSREAQRNLNNKNRQKYIVRLVNTNFCKKDLIVHLTYKDGYLPTEERAKKDMQNFIKKIRRRRKKQGLPPLKYIYVTEYVPEGEKTKKVRIHHHLIMSGGIDRDEIGTLWGKGRCQVERAQPDDFEITGFATYIGKLEQKGRHSYASSRNLDKPKVHKSVTKLSRKRFAEIINAGDERANIIESLYRGRFKYLDSTTYISQDYGGFYLYSRLRRKVSVWEEKGMDGKGQKSPPKKNKEFGNVLPCKAFLGYDWKGSLGEGEARCSIILEAVKNGEAQTHDCFKVISNTTKNRTMLKMAIDALSELKPCHLEIHSDSQYLTAGIQGRFARQKEEGYQGVKNADLIDRFLKVAEPFCVTAVNEKRNEYTEVMRIQRELRKKDMRIERDYGYGK